jgi:hypothetical protein
MKNQIDLWDKPEEQSGEFVVLAGINKRTDRQLYLFTYNDCNEWAISIVPSIMTCARATNMMNKALKDLSKNEKLRRRYGEPNFKIVPFLK